MLGNSSLQSMYKEYNQGISGLGSRSSATTPPNRMQAMSTQPAPTPQQGVQSIEQMYGMNPLTNLKWIDPGAQVQQAWKNIDRGGGDVEQGYGYNFDLAGMGFGDGWGNADWNPETNEFSINKDLDKYSSFKNTYKINPDGTMTLANSVKNKDDTSWGGGNLKGTLGVLGAALGMNYLGGTMPGQQTAAMGGGGSMSPGGAMGGSVSGVADPSIAGAVGEAVAAQPAGLEAAIAASADGGALAASGQGITGAGVAAGGATQAATGAGGGLLSNAATKAGGGLVSQLVSNILSGSQNTNSGTSNLGNLLSLISNQQGRNNQQDLIDEIKGIYSPTGAYAQQLEKQLAARDAAGGRNSQYGPRLAELMGKLGDSQARALSGLGDMYNTNQGYLNGMLGSGGRLFDQMGGMNAVSGGIGSLLGSLFNSYDGNNDFWGTTGENALDQFLQYGSGGD